MNLCNRTALTLLSSAALLTGCSTAPEVAPLNHAPSEVGSYGEQWRPQFHYTPPENWMNDPNGLVYYDGEYHLFYQYNPEGDRWGHMSWGHAVSTDLVHWETLGVAIPEADGVMAFSGSAVVDEANTSGFGSPGAPPMVAVYTGANTATGDQTQNLAYSTDRGRTWTRYAGNPVLDAEVNDFRDPKVFWYEPDRRWVMVVSRSLEQKVSIYGSPDLKTWTHLSDFGPEGATGGIWEVPDLFELPVDGDPANTKWVMAVAINGGTLYGGSGTQYFVGEFDGTTFVADAAGEEPADDVPQGTVFEDFEAETYGDWVTTGEAFGTGPAAGTLAGQLPVTNYQGERLVNSFLGGDAPQGTLTSPTFTVTEPYLNFLIGGGNHAGETAVNLLMDGEVVRTATGADGERLEWHSWDVTELVGQDARLEVVDFHSGGWGHINLDQITFADAPAQSAADGANWADYGKDFYAAITWSNAPGDAPLWLGWMNNWQYAEATPTYPWRGAQSLTRSLSLRTVGDDVKLYQEPVAVEALREKRLRLKSQTVTGTELLTHKAARGRTLEIIAEFEPGSADSFGLHVRKGSGEETVVGYDTATSEVFVDRTKSGNVGFSGDFPGVHSGPLLVEDGIVKLHIFVDESSVEVFAGDGQTVITDLIFPNPASDRLALFAEGGTANLKSLEVYQLDSIWHTKASGKR